MRWCEVEAYVPELAARARALLDVNKHKTMATVRADGGPRISGTEVEFRLGDLWLGSMPNAVKARDLQRDGRVAIHSASADPGADGAGWDGDAKLAGRAIEIVEPAAVARWVRDRDADADIPTPGDFHLFRVDLRELVITALNDDRTKLVVTWWADGQGVHSVER